MEAHSTENNNPDPEIIGSHLERFFLVVITIIATMAATNPVAFFFPPLWFFFPGGLIHPIQTILGNITMQRALSPMHPADFRASILGWFIYLGVSIMTISTRKLTRFFILYAILIFLLITNVVGCRTVVPQ